MAAAYLQERYKKGFLLTEESLFKIDELIRKRLEVNSTAPKMGFEVLRADGMWLEYENPADLLLEENSPHNRIQQISITGKSNVADVILEFDVEDHVSLKINSQLRDTAYLLFSDLKDHMNAEVFNSWLAAFDPVKWLRGLAFLTPISAIMFVAVSTAAPKVDPLVQARVLASKDISEKLNFIISERAFARSNALDPKVVLFSFLLVAFMFLLSPILRWLFPRNVFKWGKMAIALDKRAEIRKNLFWGVFVAILVGILAAALWDHIKVF